MHLHEAFLSSSPQGIAVLGGGALGAIAGTALGLRAMDYDHVPRVGMVSSAFFVISLIHVPLGVTSVHLLLNGLVGLILGWAAFPALLIALLLQAVLFGHGGLLALGVNTFAMGLPAVACWLLLRRAIGGRSDTLAFLGGCAAGMLGVLGAAFLAASALWIAGRAFELAAKAVLGFHVIVAVAEGLVTGSAIVFFRRARPELLSLRLSHTSHEAGGPR